jgi:hypothetical protein
MVVRRCKDKGKVLNDIHNGISWESLAAKHEFDDGAT